MKQKTIVLLVVLVILVLLPLSYFLGAKSTGNNSGNMSNAAVPSPTPTKIPTRTSCTSTEDCNSMYATNVAVAIATIRNAENDQRLEVNPQGNTLREQVTVYCSKSKKCWRFDNKLGELVD